MTNYQNPHFKPQVFVCKVSQKLQKISNESRQKEIDDCQNVNVKLEKYTVWQLLLHAVKKTFGVDTSTIDFVKKSNGKWTCQGFDFCFSHSKGFCAVVVDDKKVGVDLQKHDKSKFDAKLLCRIATKSELQQIARQMLGDASAPCHCDTAMIDSKRILELWCKKEALFKTLDQPNFAPSKIDTTTANFVTKHLQLENDDFCITVATESCNFDLHVVEIE